MNVFSLKDAISGAENIKTARANRNFMAQQNQRAQTQFDDSQRLENTKQLYSALTEIAQNPQAASYHVPRLKKMGVLRQDFDYSQMSPEEIQGLAAKEAESVKAGLDAYTQAGFKNVSSPSSIQEYSYFQSLSPEEKRAFLNVKRAGKVIDRGDMFVPLDPVTQLPTDQGIEKRLPPSKTIPYIKVSEQAKQDVLLAAEPERERRKMLAKREAEKDIGKPKQDRLLSATGAKTKMLGNLITKAKSQANNWTTGFMGNKLSGIAGTPAHDLSNTLNTIKANIGFDKLQEMRDSSPTGGALGQVSERENQLLQSVWGALEQSQSPKQFRENLDLVNKQVDDSWSRIKAAYKQDYGVDYSEEDLKTRVSGQVDDEYEALKQKYLK